MKIRKMGSELNRILLRIKIINLSPKRSKHNSQGLKEKKFRLI